MSSQKNTRKGFAWLELLLVLAIIALLAQSVPAIGELVQKLGQKIIFYSDVRNYSWTSWGFLNALLALLLISVRFWSGIKNTFLKSKVAFLKSKREHAQQLEREAKKQALKQEREILERMEEGRSRRLY